MARESARRSRGVVGADERTAFTGLVGLPDEGWRVLHDVPWPGRPGVLIDHVVVGPPGVFVVEVKAWEGEVTVRDGVVWVDRHPRHARATGAAEAARAVSAQLQPVSYPVTPVVCMVRDDAITADADGVLVCSAANVAKQLLVHRAVLSDAQVTRLARELSGRRLAMTPPAPVRRTRPAHPVRYLVGALVAMACAAFLVSRPEIVTDLGEGVSGVFVDVSTVFHSLD